MLTHSLRVVSQGTSALRLPVPPLQLPDCCLERLRHLVRAAPADEVIDGPEPLDAVVAAAGDQDALGLEHAQQLPHLLLAQAGDRAQGHGGHVGKERVCKKTCF